VKKLFIASVALVVFGASPAFAEAPGAPHRFQLAPYAGVYIPTGDHRDVFDDSVLVGLSASYDVIPYVAVVASVGWTPTQAGALDLDLFKYDAGVQGQYPYALSPDLVLKPFLGVGAGARTYHFRDLDSVDAETDFAAYVSAGVQLEYRALAVGLTVRDDVTPFDGIDADGDSQVRGDLAVFGSVGVRF